MTTDANGSDFRTLHYGDDITTAHLDGLTDFLTARLAPLADVSGAGTESHRAAAALRRLVLDLAYDVRRRIESRDADLARGLDTTWTLTTRQQILRQWNSLVGVAEQWRDTADGLQYAPWHRVTHHNAQSEAEDQARLAERADETGANA
ncbi:hypothetical protein ABZ502_29940 [Streptomyces abikoensis]|uniref:hypothetical protein n=1 Tax=Streptomyces abikoensis TaxID=97398 RepID=UPI0033F52465